MSVSTAPVNSAVRPITGVQNLALALILFTLISAIGLLARPLLPIDETRYVSVAWEMWNNGNYLIPHLNGEIYTHKPPLLFWLINLIWSLGGVSELSARIVGPIAGLVCICLTHVLGKALWPKATFLGARGALVLATTGFFLIFASLTMFDALLSVGALTSFVALVNYHQTQKKVWLLLLGFGLAFGVYAKGPVIFVHVLPLALVMPWLPQSKFKTQKTRWYLGIGSALLIALLLVSVWLGPALYVGGEAYFKAAVWHQAVGRIGNAFDHQKPVWFYLMLLPLIIWPWGWIPQIWKKLRLKTLMADTGLQILATSMICSLAIFSLISGKQVHYLLPVMPLFALFIARVLDRGAHISLLAPMLLFAAVTFALIALLVPDLLPLQEFNQFVSTRAVLSAAGIGIVFMGTIIWLYGRKSAAVFMIAPSLVLMVYLALAIPLQRSYSAVPIGLFLQENAGQPVAYIGQKYHGMFNFEGRLTAPVAVLASKEQVGDWSAAHPGGLMIGRFDRTTPPWTPAQIFIFRNRTYGIWRTAS